MHVFDTSPFSVLFRNYYRKIFPSLWKKFDDLVKRESVNATHEVFLELMDSSFHKSAKEWSNRHPRCFQDPTREEARFVRTIFSIEHFQHVIEKKKIVAGGKNSDAFVIAKAFVLDAKVVTLEKRSTRSAKIPDICSHFAIDCITMEDLMEE